MRDVQATSASFIREMERAADEPEPRPPRAPDPYVPEPYEADSYVPEARVAEAYTPPHESLHETVPLDPLITTHAKNAPSEPEALNKLQGPPA